MNVVMKSNQRRTSIIIGVMTSVVLAVLFSWITAFKSASSVPSDLNTGTVTCTTDTLGWCAGPALPWTPNAVTVEAQNPVTGSAIPSQHVTQIVANGFRVRFISQTGSALNTRAVTYSYVATRSVVAPPTTTPPVTTTPVTTTPPVSTTPATTPPPTTSPPPPPVGFPDASNTGVPLGTVLTKVPSQATSGAGWTWNTGGWIQASNGATITNLDVAGSLQGGTGLTVKNTLIRCTNENSFCLTGSSLTVTDTSIGGGADGTTCQHAPAIWTAGTSTVPSLIQRVNMGYVVHGPHIDGDTLMVDSYVHDLPDGTSCAGHTGDHTDGVFISTGQGITIRHDSFVGGNTANLFVQDYGNTPEGVGNLLIENSLFTNNHYAANGDSSFGVDIENKDIKGPITVRNNTFKLLPCCWTIGPGQAPPGSVVTGNVNDDGSPAWFGVS